jgi:hypothetical protein
MHRQTFFSTAPGQTNIPFLLRDISRSQCMTQSCNAAQSLSQAGKTLKTPKWNNTGGSFGGMRADFPAIVQPSQLFGKQSWPQWD